jgi:hypothetical protein
MHGFCRRQQVSGVRQELYARCGEDRGSTVTDEQGRLQLVLEGADLARQRGLGDV